TLKRIGVSADTTLSNVYLFDGSTRLTDAASVSGGSLITFSGLSIAVSDSRTIAVKADLAGNAGETVGVQLTAVTLSSDTVSGLPVSGVFHSIASAALAGVAVGTPVPSSAATTDPENDVRVWESTFTITTRDVTFTRLALRQINSIATADIQNFRLLIDGVQVAQVDNLDANKYVTFAFSKTLTTGSRNVKVLADVIGGSSYKIQMSLRVKADIEVTDSQYGANIAVTGTIPASTAEITVNAGTMTVEKASDSPTGNVTNSASDVTLGKWTFTAYGEPIKVETLLVDFTYADAGGSVVNAAATLRSGRIVVNGSQVGSTTTLNPASTGTSFTTNFTVSPGSPATVEVRADIYDDDGTGSIETSDTITATLSTGSSNAEKTVSLGRINVPDPNKDANQVTVAQGTIALAKNPTYADQNTVVPQTAYKLAAFNLTGNTTEDVNIYTISVDFSAVTPATGGTFTAADLSSVYVKYGTNNTTVKSTVSATGNSWSISYTLAKMASIPVEIYTSIGSTITADHSIRAEITITGTTALSAQSATTGEVNGQEITAKAGSFTATKDASSPVARIVADNQTVDVAAFKFAAVNDKYSISRLIFSLADATAVNNVILKDGTTVLATLPGATTVTFNLPSSGTGSASVNANASKVLTVSLELGTVGIGAGTSGASLLTTLTSGLAIPASTGVLGTITESDPASSALYVYAS
ncbi:MAG: hypothetical protein COX36_00050, partial [Candidatus Nealsonbacteria bacterium CG23_combo_of_CG06-09_8_20_14_all_38_19]